MDLIGCDGVAVHVDDVFLERALTLKNLLSDTGILGTGEAIPLPNVDSETIATIQALLSDDLSKTDLYPTDKDLLDRLTMAFNYLDIQEGLEACARIHASNLKGKTPEEIRQYFGIENDLSPEEVERIQEENSWARPASE